MKVDGRISILVGDETTVIHVEDENANTRFLELTISNAEFTRALGRSAHLPCDLNIRGLDNIGKTHENKTHEFELPDGTNWKNREEVAIATAKGLDLGDWIPEPYFRSQNSFFIKDGKDWARCTIRRYV